jgi:hypothetical protein
MASTIENDLRQAPATRVSVLGIALICLTLAIVASIFARHVKTELGHDQVSYLFEAQRFLSGAEPYGPQLSETNPPLIIWFSAIPVQLAHWLHATPQTVFRALVFLMLMGCTAWSVALLRRSPNAAFANPLGLYLFGAAILLTGLVPGRYDFGQREHLLVLLLVPYILAVASSTASLLPLAERCASGVAAGIAIWFKPHDALILIALELFLALRTRSLRRLRATEFLALVLTCVVIFALVLIATPLYCKQTVPLLFDTYWALGTKTTLALALTLKLYLPLVCILFLLGFLLRKTMRDPAFFTALLLSSLAASVAFDLQHTDWVYHRYPHQAFLLLAMAYVPIDLLTPQFERLTADSRRRRRIAITAFGALSLILFIIVTQRPFPPYVADLDQIYSRYPPSTTVYVFTTRVPPLATAYNHNLTWGSRFAHLWMMPAILQNELGASPPPAPFKRLAPETLARIAALQRAQSTADLNYWRPSVVLVERCNQDNPCQGIEGKTFSMLDWFLQSPQFTQAWSHYQQRPSPSPIYDLYIRVE